MILVSFYVGFDLLIHSTRLCVQFVKSQHNYFSKFSDELHYFNSLLDKVPLNKRAFRSEAKKDHYDFDKIEIQKEQLKTTKTKKIKNKKINQSKIYGFGASNLEHSSFDFWKYGFARQKNISRKLNQKYINVEFSARIGT